MTFAHLATYFQQLEATSSRLTMTELLAQLFSEAESQEIGKLCYLLQGRVAPLYEPIEFGVADKFMLRAIAQAYSASPERVTHVFHEKGDVGLVAETFHTNHGSHISVAAVFDTFYELATESGEGSQERKIAVLARLFASVDVVGCRYIARIPLGKLRLGFSDMTILDSLSWMMTNDKSLRPRLEATYNVRPDIGVLAQKLKEDGVEGLRKIHSVVGAPVLSALCQRIKTADEMIAKMGKVDVEPKYDGVRVQIHYKLKVKGGKDAEVRTFSRNLENTTEMFPELGHIGNQVKAESVILDSEAVGVDPKTGKILPFQETTTRKRKYGIEKASVSVPLRFYVFDILSHNGKDLLALPLHERRDILQKTIVQGTLLELAPHIITEDPKELRAYHEEQRKKGLEGVVVKKWDAPYEPGRKGYSWVKFKEEEGAHGKLTDTIDGVVMGYYYGEGKRSGFGIGAFLVGVRDGDGFLSVTKIGTGVGDEQWRELKKRFEAVKTKEKPKQYGTVDKLLTPDVWIEPGIVVEIAGDNLTKSKNHGAGYAIRFPRLVRMRDDKSPDQATSKAEIHKLYMLQ